MGYKLIKHLESTQYNRKLFYLDEGEKDLPPIINKTDIQPGSECRSLTNGDKWILNTKYQWMHVLDGDLLHDVPFEPIGQEYVRKTATNGHGYWVKTHFTEQEEFDKLTNRVDEIDTRVGEQAWSPEWGHDVTGFINEAIPVLEDVVGGRYTTATYDETREYVKDETIIYQEQMYICIVAKSTKGKFKPNEWEAVDSEILQYIVGKHYNAGQIVFNVDFYVVRQAFTATNFNEDKTKYLEELIRLRTTGGLNLLRKNNGELTLETVPAKQVDATDDNQYEEVQFSGGTQKALNLSIDQAIHKVREALNELNTVVNQNKTAADNSISGLNQSMTTIKTSLEGADAQLATDIADAVDQLNTLIETLRTTLTGQIDQLSTRVTNNKTSADNSIETINNTLTSLRSDIQTLQTNYTSLESRVDALEKI